ncbi:MoxR-like ATPase in aerotolerance operon [uncultured Gammaproteobacteria bacterium]|jgi:MoxR-like ATPase|uniref:AAA family ATPase n=1 Tax=thiotrophic endosymbiont of Bathymodiolus puteoserpentis (Logatchev) TaxID=343240 RepID=UPI0010B8109B|nr:MoxR family ATPase [thiotrophic endosymbiont of Bathymodiolus puteoserpentis (Logatchev)]CAC9497295.1 MoxR-like ATPase in aerotolerance operon [uncultured Gammaproteobacteria bacterium]CAC9501263.1 MoxR-like ATPase in aerotolerance operon [uncultured Gammaproteobacteria bacterium]CAC9575554.1 MoxR-like ATPase in aerotolerance operon [uncultured Gammaproteobacteria bacterium]CAC9632451.1 MoxR-like ATPase in aerotolerance operon [uncultured Gammaproteobacteria bacterium]CAC9637861.1 MoxR-like
MIKKLKTEIQKVIIGQEDLVDHLLIGLITGGHILVESVPGLAKTTAINTLSKALGIQFKRIQFTPDLLPSDLTGAQIYNPKTGEFSVKKGPIFTNLLLADEINRAPAKVQAALLEVMAERQVTIADESFKLDQPFLVMATQNPVEQEGTYQLPEAQLDRFMLKTVLDYNTLAEELEVVKRVAINGFEQVEQVADIADIVDIRQQFEKIHVDDAVQNYILKIIFATRYPQDYGLDSIKHYIEFGASPRASIDLYKASCAKALIRGNDFVTPLDIASVVTEVLQHRIVLSYQAQAENMSVEAIIKQILEAIQVP